MARKAIIDSPNQTLLVLKEENTNRGIVFMTIYNIFTWVVIYRAVALTIGAITN